MEVRGVGTCVSGLLSQQGNTLVKYCSAVCMAHLLSACQPLRAGAELSVGSGRPLCHRVTEQSKGVVGVFLLCESGVSPGCATQYKVSWTNGAAITRPGSRAGLCSSSAWKLPEEALMWKRRGVKLYFPGSDRR
ncbi:hypothetical protein EYF80_003710 [Liparis tanakae]|uniref:Uncharacterized protein n=1 Tax=Liparis tanakae TaxID=230148 RepID=A0A4Z2J6Q3_9TELE|nr:hypothetical protein EYF80_003710 [Liparis tanakae]